MISTNDLPSNISDIIIESIDNFLLEGTKILIDYKTNLPKEYNDGININLFFIDCIDIAEFVMEVQKYICIIPYGKTLPVKKGKIEESNILEILNLIPDNLYLYDKQFIIKIKDDFDIVKEYGNNIMLVLNSMIHNKILYDHKFIIEIEKVYNIMIYYENCRDMYNKQKNGYTFVKIENFLSELENIQKIQINKMNYIIECFYKIQNIRNKNENDVKSILEFINLIITNLKEALQYYKQISYTATNLLISDIDYYIKRCYGSIISNEINECCIQILSNEVENIFKSNIHIKYIDQINKLYQHSCSLSDKLTILLSMQD
jgi:hypothetical protein